MYFTGITIGIGCNSMPYVKDCDNDDGIVFP